jgi:D-serine deaminase-like pyridoxal phosphate-dependent protein
MQDGFIAEVDTPALIVDLDVMDRNIGRMAEMAKENGVSLRPHIKTHKSPWIAQQQLEAGATGVTTAKLGEAEVMVAGGVNDILIAFPLVGAAKLRRLEALLQEADVKVSLDDVEVAEGISRVGQRIGRRVPVYLEIDTGLQRVGVPSGQAGVELALAVARLPGVEIQAVMTHGGHVGKATTFEELAAVARRQAEDLVQTAEAISRAGVPVATVSPGSTLAAQFEGATDGVTEIRPGTYVFNDANTVRRWTASEDDCAATIVATVVSRPAPDRAIIDAGSKTFSSDGNIAGTAGFGIVRGRPDLTLAWLTEEHGIVRLDGDSELKIGDRLAIIPNHVCPTVNLARVMYGVRHGRLEREIPVAARGCLT